MGVHSNMFDNWFEGLRLKLKKNKVPHLFIAVDAYIPTNKPMLLVSPELYTKLLSELNVDSTKPVSIPGKKKAKKK